MADDSILRDDLKLRASILQKYSTYKKSLKWLKDRFRILNEDITLLPAIQLNLLIDEVRTKIIVGVK